jgi:hypothetical protein
LLSSQSSSSFAVRAPLFISANLFNNISGEYFEILLAMRRTHGRCNRNVYG